MELFSNEFHWLSVVSSLLFWNCKPPRKKMSSSHVDPTVIDLSLWMLDWLFHLLSTGPLAEVCGISLGNLKPGIAGHCSWCAVESEEGERLLQQVVQEAVKPVSIGREGKERKSPLGESKHWGRRQMKWILKQVGNLHLALPLILAQLLSSLSYSSEFLPRS